jgi:hypothetical protein
MNTLQACQLLNLTLPFTTEELKKQYHRKALQYHPDKNKSENAKQMFQEIRESYEFLKNKRLGKPESTMDECRYSDVLFSFLQDIFPLEEKHPPINMFFFLFNRVISLCEEKALGLLERLDESTLQYIHKLVEKYPEVLHLSPKLVDKIRELGKTTRENKECVLLHPHLDDLWENRLYKLTVGDSLFVVPLWHHELVYDHSGGEILIHCLPVLDDHIDIDENNHLHVDVSFCLKELWEKDTVWVPLGIRSFPINTRVLKLTPKQTIFFSQQGIPMINTRDVYDVSTCGNVHIHLTIVG